MADSHRFQRSAPVASVFSTHWYVSVRARPPLRVVLSVAAAVAALSLGGCGGSCTPESATAHGRDWALADRHLADKPGAKQDCAQRFTQEWLVGWEAGQRELCQPLKGWRMGQQGVRKYQNCAAETNRPGTYLSAYRLGSQLKVLESEAGLLEEMVHEGKSLSATQTARQRALRHEISALRALALQQGFIEPQAESPAEPVPDQTQSADGGQLEHGPEDNPEGGK